MATVAASFNGKGDKYTSGAVAHAGGKVQLIVFGSPANGGCRVSIWKEVAAPVSAYKELVYPILEGQALRIDLEACNLRFEVTPQSENSDFTVELVTK